MRLFFKTPQQKYDALMKKRRALRTELNEIIGYPGTNKYVSKLDRKIEKVIEQLHRLREQYLEIKMADDE